MSFSCELCGTEREVLRKRGRRTTYKPCPSCELYNAAVAAQKAAALSLARARFPKKQITFAWLNEYGCFADFEGVSGHQVASAEEVIPFVKLTSAARDAYPGSSGVTVEARVAPRDPLWEALWILVGRYPPEFVRKIRSTRELTDEQVHLIQDWCATHSRPSWATGLSMIEAAELIVDGAIENGNIEE